MVGRTNSGTLLLAEHHHKRPPWLHILKPEVEGKVPVVFVCKWEQVDPKRRSTDIQVQHFLEFDNLKKILYNYLRLFQTINTENLLLKQTWQTCKGTHLARSYSE